MTPSALSVSIVALAATAAFASSLLGENPRPSAGQEPEPRIQDPREKMPRPGPQHRRLQDLEGSWTTSVKHHPAPGAPPQESTGVEVNTLSCGGLWLITSYTCKTSDGAFEGHGITGFDPAAGVYQSTWVDSMSTGLSVSTGRWDQGDRAFHWELEGQDPAGRMVRYHMVNQFKSDDHRVLTSRQSIPGEDEDFVNLVIEYRRTKAAEAVEADSPRR